VKHVGKATPRRTRRGKASPEGASPVDVRALLERVVRVAAAVGASEAGVFVTADASHARSSSEISVVPDGPRGRAWLAAVARAGRVLRSPEDAESAGASFPAGRPQTLLVVPAPDAAAVLYAAGKPDGFTSEDEELFASLGRLVAAAVPRMVESPDAAPSELVSMISHELRNPLASIRGFGVLLRDRTDSLSDDERREFVDAIVRQTDNLSNLIGDVLDVSQMVAGRFRYAALPYDAGELLLECVGDARAAYPGHRFRLDTGDLPSVSGDRDRIKQVLLNLLSNACRYSKEGSAVTVTAHGKDDSIEVSVADEGVGIEPGDLPRLFGRFERLHRASLPKVKGTGLGLYIAKQIVEAHGGSIVARSEPGRGTVFTFEVPLAARFE
jgi:signal transduction histidine kinase